MSDKRESIIGRIAKLLALASDSGATPNESAVAMKQARKLMIEYSLSESDVENSGLGSMGITRVYLRTKRMPEYAAILGHDLDEIFGTTGGYEPGHYNGKGRACCIIVGYRQQRAICAHFLVSLMTQIDVFTIRKRNATGWGRALINEYRVGMVNGLTERLKTLFSPAVPGGQSPAEEYGLVWLGNSSLVKDAERHCLEIFGRVPRAREVNTPYGPAYYAGVADSQRATVANPVGEGGTRERRTLGT